ncbi:MAG: class I SAM-dependent methyltransferase family protein [Candidatus Aenigmarchaeota archaeon]|nr:class I SAM-dependent methyltransferase family protein [Candidatus Aenigmarchaeota archaeon]
MRLKDALKDRFSPAETALLGRSFDLVGAIAIIEIPEGLEKRKRDIATAIVAMHPRIKTVLAKKGARKARLRNRAMEKIIGWRVETVHKEYGFMLKLNVRQAYFSPREATERQRIASQVQDGETVLVMFAGVGPYALAIAKRKPAKVWAIELNKPAFRYLQHNAKINKLKGSVDCIQGDAGKVAKNLYGKCDRVVMPLPLHGYRYLPIAIECLKGRGIIHFYHTGSAAEPFAGAEARLAEACQGANAKLEIIGRQIVLPYAPHIYKVCIDAEVRK